MEALAAEITDYLFFIAIRDEYVHYRYTDNITSAEQIARDHLLFVKSLDWSTTGSRNIPSSQAVPRLFEKMPKFRMLIDRIAAICQMREQLRPSSMGFFKPLIDHASKKISFSILGTKYSIPINEQICSTLHRELHNHRMLSWFILFTTLRAIMTLRQKTQKNIHYFEICGTFFENNPDIREFIISFGYKKRIAEIDIDIA